MEKKANYLAFNKEIYENFNEKQMMRSEPVNMLTIITK